MINKNVSFVLIFIIYRIIFVDCYFMFNPKEALERIRKNKIQKSQTKSFIEESLVNTEQPLFQESKPTEADSIEKRVKYLQHIVSNLTEQLSVANETASKLRRQNSSLQTQLLKIQYENSQLKNNSVVAEIKSNYSRVQNHKNDSNTQRIYDNEFNKKTYPLQHQFEKQSINNKFNKSNVTGQRLLQGTVEEQVEQYSPEVQEILDQIKKQPVDNILRKRENQFRACKATNRQIQVGNKYLQKLANLEREYSKTWTKKPVIIVKLDQGDFEN